MQRLQNPGDRTQKEKHINRYIVLYKAPISVAKRFAQATEAEAMAGLKMWIDWAKKLGSVLLDPGKPLGNATRVTKDSITRIDSQVIGMSLLQAISLDAAIDMVRNHHYLSWANDCEIEVLEEMPIPELAASIR